VILSRHFTKALNASVPDLVRAAGRGRTATIMIVGPVYGASALGILAMGLGINVGSYIVVIVAQSAGLIGVQLVGVIIAVRAKRVFQRIASIVNAETQATLVGVVGSRVHVRLVGAAQVGTNG
jgi:hypothetical protein